VSILPVPLLVRSLHTEVSGASAMVEDKAMRAREFHADAGYLAWLAVHPDGYVINIARSHGTTAARVHVAA
jgi:hypothetical protein